MRYIFIACCSKSRKEIKKFFVHLMQPFIHFSLSTFFHSLFSISWAYMKANLFCVNSTFLFLLSNCHIIWRLIRWLLYNLFEVFFSFDVEWQKNVGDRKWDFVIFCCPKKGLILHRWMVKFGEISPQLPHSYYFQNKIVLKNPPDVKHNFLYISFLYL